MGYIAVVALIGIGAWLISTGNIVNIIVGIIIIDIGTTIGGK